MKLSWGDLVDFIQFPQTTGFRRNILIRHHTSLQKNKLIGFSRKEPYFCTDKSCTEATCLGTPT